MADDVEGDLAKAGIEVNLEDPIERDILWRYTEIWRRMPRYRRTDQGWADLVMFCRDEIDRHRAELKAGRGALGPA
jgi:hypothetical protein